MFIHEVIYNNEPKAITKLLNFYYQIPKIIDKQKSHLLLMTIKVKVCVNLYSIWQTFFIIIYLITYVKNILKGCQNFYKKLKILLPIRQNYEL